MSIVKRHQTPLPRMVLESCLIEMGEKNGSWILNSKNSFNRCSIPRISITVNDKIHSEVPENKENLTDKDIEEIFENKKKKDRKTSRNDSNNEASSNHIHLPASKRRKNSNHKHDDIDRGGPSRSDKDDNDGHGVTRTDCQHEEHKQGLKQFPIFSKQARPELKGRRRNKPRSDRRSPPNFNYIKISDHFKPKPVSTVRPDDPGTEGEPSAGDSVV